MQGAREILDFWFSDDSRERWFDATADFDQTIRKRFGEAYARAATGALKSWETSAEGCLALCILLDQMPRNMFRGQARAYATDDKALRVAEHALSLGFDRQLPVDRKQFIYLPFMHSESLANQLRALALYEHAGLFEGLRWAEDHVRIIRRFGRFPHRNAILGRAATPAEEAFLKDNPESFGQALEEAPASSGHDDAAPASAGAGARRSR